MKKLSLLVGLIALIVSAGRGVSQGSNGKVLFASDFGEWTMPQGTSPTNGMIQYSSPEICKASSEAYNFVGPKVGRPLRIHDIDPTLTETVIPTAVIINNSTCTIAATMAHTHYSYYLESGTGGLQEALDYNATRWWGALIALTPQWTEQGGLTSMLSLAVGNNSMGIIDERQSCFMAYNWSGSPITGYTLTANFCSSGGSGGGPVIQTNGIRNALQNLLNFTSTSTITWSNPSGGIEQAACNNALSTQPGCVQPDNTSITVSTGGIIHANPTGVSSVSASSLPPLFTTVVNTPTTTPSIVFTLSFAPSFSFYGNFLGASATPAFWTAVAGTGITITPNVGAQTVTFASTGGGGSGTVPAIPVCYERGTQGSFDNPVSTIFCGHKIPVPVTVPSGCTGSTANTYASGTGGSAPTATGSVTWTFQDFTTSTTLCSFAWSASGSVAAISGSGGTINAGDSVGYVGAATADATLSNVGLAVNGTAVGGGGGGPGSVTQVSTGTWPAWLTPSVTNPTTTPQISVTASAIPNSALANSTIPINTVTCTLGSACTVGIVGGALGSLPYQSAVNTTTLLASPTTSGHNFMPLWSPTGAPVAPVMTDLLSLPPLGAPSIVLSGTGCPICSNNAGNTDVTGELSFTSAATATYNWTASPGYLVHPEVVVTPQFDPGSGVRYWVTYTGTTSFTINFSTTVTGTVSYVAIGRTHS